MASQVEVIRANREADVQRQIAATNFGSPEVEQVAPGIPVSNDAALAAHIQEVRNSNAEYARLRTEEARQQWEAIEADNFRRSQSAASEVSDKMAVETLNRTVRQQQDAERAFSEWSAVAKTVDPVNDTEWTLPLDKVRDLAVHQQKLINATGFDPLAPIQPGQLQKVTPNDAETVTQNQDGTWTVKYQTGEIFTGDAESVMRAQAAGHVNTKLWARQQRQMAEQVQQPAAPPAENPGQDLTGSLADDLAARQRESVARSFGFSSADEMIQDYQTNKQVAQEAQQFIQEAKQDRAISSFWATHPDFPGTDQANDALGQIIDERGWEVSAENLELAHSLAVQRHMYEPLSQDAIAQSYGAAPARRAAAAPMLRTNNPEVTNASPDPYNMPLQDLRKAAIAQALAGTGPNYR